jgi:hypothetical protein
MGLPLLERASRGDKLGEGGRTPPGLRSHARERRVVRGVGEGMVRLVAVDLGCIAELPSLLSPGHD